MQAHRGTSSKLSHRRGFTLVELVITIAIIATIAAVAVPRFAAADTRYRLSLASQRIMSDLSVTAASASAAGTTRPVFFDPVGDTYVMMGVESRGRAMNRWVDLSRKPYDADLISATFTDATHLRMTGHGVAETDGVIIVAAGREAKRIRLTANSPTVGLETLRLTQTPTNDILPSVSATIDDGSVDVLGTVTTARATR